VIKISGWVRDGSYVFPETDPDAYNRFEIELEGQDAHDVFSSSSMLQLVRGQGKPITIIGLEIETEDE